MVDMPSPISISLRGDARIYGKNNPSEKLFLYVMENREWTKDRMDCRWSIKPQSYF